MRRDGGGRRGAPVAAMAGPTWPSPPLSPPRSVLSPQRLVTAFPDAPGVTTLHDNLEDAIRRHPDVRAGGREGGARRGARAAAADDALPTPPQAPYLGQRQPTATGAPGPYDWMTYAEAGAARTAVGAGLAALGVAAGAAVGLYSVNCRDWVLVDAALHAYGMVSVPLYDTLGEDAVSYICGHAGLAAVAASAAALPTLLHALPSCPTVKLVVVYGLPTGGVPPPAPPGSAARVVTLNEVAAAGRARPSPHAPPRPTDVATLCYTSGTTGVPKGAILTHGALIANAAGSFHILSAAPGDSHISYLPLAHIYERVTVIGITHCGAAVGFYSGDVANLLDDVLTLQPTIFCSVPRLWNRIHDRITAQVRESSPVARRLFAAAYAHKLAALKRRDPSGGGARAAFWDRLVFSKVRARLGGRVRLMTSGASPIAADVIDFMR